MQLSSLNNGAGKCVRMILSLYTVCFTFHPDNATFELAPLRYAWLGIMCSTIMILFHMFVGIFLTCRQSAMLVARRGRQLDRE